MSWWKTALSWFVKSGAAKAVGQAVGKAVVTKVTKKKDSGGAAKE
jgi:hypothetical protein